MTKKTITKIACVLTTLVLSTSCSSTSGDDYVADESRNSVLLETLGNYNNAVLAGSPSTRVSEHTLNVIVEDIYGAFKGGQKAYKFTKNFPDKRVTVACTLLGGAIYGGYKSYKAVPQKNDNNNGGFINGKGNLVSIPISKDSLKLVALASVADEGYAVNFNSLVFKDSLTLKSVELDNGLLSSVNLTREQLNLGKLHNIILASMDGTIKVNNAYRIESSDKTIKAVIDSPEMEELYNVMGTDQEEEYFNTDENPMPDKVMELFNQVFKGAANDYDTVVRLINKYSEEIDKTDELTDVQKASIKNGLATAVYSFNYWKTQSKK